MTDSIARQFARKQLINTLERAMPKTHETIRPDLTDAQQRIVELLDDKIELQKELDDLRRLKSGKKGKK